MKDEHAGPGLLDRNPSPDVLADLLVAASEAGPERLIETDRLLRDLVGPDVVNEAHEVWTARLREGVAPPAPATPPEDVFELTRRLRASSPGKAGRS